MQSAETDRIVAAVRALIEAKYIHPDVASAASQLLGQGLADGRYPADPQQLAGAITADLLSASSDQHLRLLFHAQAQPMRAPGDDAEEYAAMTRWAGQTCGGVGRVERLAGNVGYLDLRPVLFPAVISADAITAAMSLLAGTDALLLDVRGCLGGEPGMVTFLLSYLWDHEPVQLTGLRRSDGLRQAWTLAHVPGRRFGKAKPVYVLTSATTFSGGEQLSYDLQQLGRAVIVGERTRGGAHAREGYTVHPHLEVTISVAESVSPVSGGNWEGTGVVPGIATAAAEAFGTARRLALRDVVAAAGACATEARAALTAEQDASPGEPDS
jgi:C-terminal processing protease CtpA/Prc